MSMIMSEQSAKSIEDEFQLATYAKMDIELGRGLASTVWTTDGQEYLDLYGGHAVCATGHCHPHVVKAITEQAERLLFYSNLVYSDVRGVAAQKLVEIAPDALTKVFFCNSGTEANENAMRLARMATGREKIVSFSGGFHGRTADSIAATFLGNYRAIGKPNVPGHIKAEFGDAVALAAVIDNETAGVIIEPIQSMAGVVEAGPEYFVALREACDRAGAVLIFDEVQTGMGRTGSWFFAESDAAGGVIPDIVTLAKSLGSGIPVGACIVNERTSSTIKINDLGTTFGGGMIAMAAVLATIEAIANDGMMANATRIEEHIRTSLAGSEHVAEVRGKGCLLGIKFHEPCKPFHQKLLDEHIITGTSSDPRVLRLLPPLCVTQSEIDKFLQVLKG
jgi:acetylornithine/succinyldiaminopimelate/putrescine aminotransferase